MGQIEGPVDGLTPLVSMCDPWICSMSITWELVRNKNTWAPSHTCSVDKARKRSYIRVQGSYPEDSDPYPEHQRSHKMASDKRLRH
jgi:hypothetical protein